jgi:hypothetical protein
MNWSSIPDVIVSKLQEFPRKEEKILMMRFWR